MVRHWRLLWSHVMVRSVKVTHPGYMAHAKIISFSFVAFERSIRPENGSTANVHHRCKRESRTDAPIEELLIKRDSRVAQHIPTNFPVNEISSSSSKIISSFRKRRPFGRDSNREATLSIEQPTESFRDPVNTGGLEDWISAGCGLELMPSVVEKWSQVVTERSSRRGNERTRLKMGEGGKSKKSTRRDLVAGENPWNGTRHS